MSAGCFSVNDKVYVKSIRTNGTVKFAGSASIHHKNGYWYGLELDDPLGDCDGSINDEVYFSCYDYYGTFCQEQDLKLIQKAPVHNVNGLNASLLQIHQSTTSLQSVTSENDSESQGETMPVPKTYSKKIAPTRHLPLAPNKSLPPVPNKSNNKTLKERNTDENNKYTKAQSSVKLHSNIESLNFIQLKHRCSTLGIASYGTKLQLLERLRKHTVIESKNDEMPTQHNKTHNNETQNVVVNSNLHENNNNSIDGVSNIDAMNKVQLMRECNIHGISMFGSENDLRQRLKAHLHASTRDSKVAMSTISNPWLTHSKNFATPKLKNVSSVKNTLWGAQATASQYSKRVSSYVNNKMNGKRSADATWKNKHINNWNSSELIDWLKTINIGMNVSGKIIQDISTQQLCGSDFNSLKSPLDIINSFNGMSQRIANKIFDELAKVRKLNTTTENMLQMNLSLLLSMGYDNPTAKEAVNKFSKSEELNNQKLDSKINVSHEHNYQILLAMGFEGNIALKTAKLYPNPEHINEAITYLVTNDSSDINKKINQSNKRNNPFLLSQTSMRRGTHITSGKSVIDPIRAEWTEGSKVRIRSDNIWYIGEIKKIYSDNHGIEILDVSFSKGIPVRKSVQRYEDSIKPIYESFYKREQNNKLQKQVEINRKQLDELKQNQNEIQKMIQELQEHCMKRTEFEERLKPQSHEILQSEIRKICKDKSKKVFFNTFVQKIIMAFYDSKAINSECVQHEVVFKSKAVQVESAATKVTSALLKTIPFASTVIDMVHGAVEVGYDVLILRKAAKNTIDFESYLIFPTDSFAKQMGVVLVTSGQIIKELENSQQNDEESDIDKLANKYGEYLLSLLSTGYAMRIMDKLIQQDVRNDYINVFAFLVLTKDDDTKNVKRYKRAVSFHDAWNDNNLKDITDEITPRVKNTLKDAFEYVGSSNFLSDFIDAAKRKL